MLELPKIRLLVLAPLVLLFLVPPRFLHGLNTWLAKYWVPAPRAAPQAAESMAWLPVKNLVFGEFWFWLLPCWGRSRVKLGLPWGAVEARTRREARTAREICIFFSAVRQGWSLYGWSATAEARLVGGQIYTQWAVEVPAPLVVPATNSIVTAG